MWDHRRRIIAVSVWIINFFDFNLLRKHAAWRRALTLAKASLKQVCWWCYQPTTRSSFQGRALFFSCEIESSKQMFDKLCGAINNFEIFLLSHSCAGYYSSILHYKIPSTDVEFKNLQKRKNLIFIHRSRYILRAKSREGRWCRRLFAQHSARERKAAMNKWQLMA